MSSLEETPGREMGVSDKGDIHKVQWGGGGGVGRPGTGLRNSALVYNYIQFNKDKVSLAFFRRS